MCFNNFFLSNTERDEAESMTRHSNCINRKYVKSDEEEGEERKNELEKCKQDRLKRKIKAEATVEIAPPKKLKSTHRVV